ncbi:MAG: hypothetical protein Kow0075_15060 [Salibacteraceae bacterium]
MRMEKHLHLLFWLIWLVACDRNQPKPDDTFDKEAMLSNYSNEVVLPAYENADAATSKLNDVAAGFVNQPDASKLTSLRNALNQAYLAWVIAETYELGPAASANLRLTVNTFPVDSTQVMKNIEAGSWDLFAAQNSDARGLPALDLLLNAFPDDTLLVWMQARPSVGAYIMDNISLVVESVGGVISEWKSGYGKEFETNTASDVGSPIGTLVNQINYEFELLKNARIGIPMGKKTLGEPRIASLEAYYADYSKELAMANCRGIADAFTGGQGSGLDDYLDDLGAKYGNRSLSDAIKMGFEEIINELSNIDGSLSEAIKRDPGELEAVYSAIERQVVLLKTDMPSQLGVQITYQDNDGD